MPRYRIETNRNQYDTFIVTADSRDEAEDMVYGGNVESDSSDWGDLDISEIVLIDENGNEIDEDNPTIVNSGPRMLMEE